MIKYIPEFIYEKFEKGKLKGKFQGIALFFDIKDFTTITESLTRKGQKGAEAINGILRNSFAPVIDVIENRGGFVTGFAGDAFMSVFPEPCKDNIFDVYYTIKESLKNAPYIKEIAEDYQVDARLVVSYGEISWKIFDNDIQNEYYFFGKAIQECNSLAEKKIDLLFSEPAMDFLGKENFYETNGMQLPKDDLELAPASLKKEYSYSQDSKNSFLNKSFRNITAENQIRDIANTFIDLNAIKTEDLNSVIKEIEIIADRYQAFFNKLDYSDKGLLGIVVFGAPKRHEKTLDRIMYFSLELTEKFNKLRLGVSSGRVYAGFTGSDNCMEYTILGYPPNLASRLMMKAEKGEILLDIFSEEFLRSKFEFELLGEIGMKGFTQKLPVYKYISAKKCLESVPQIPFSGRVSELENIRGVIENKDIPECKIIYIHGDPGIGKTRIIDEVKKQLNLAKLTWCYFLCDGILKKPYAAVVRFLKEYFQYSHEAGVQKNEENFSNLWAMFAGDNEELLRIKSIIGQLLGLHWRGSIWEMLPNEVKQIQERNALISFFIELSKTTKLIIQVEDGQWIDKDTLEFLQALVKNDIETEINIIISLRYDDDGSKLDYQLSKDSVLDVELKPLSEESTLNIIRYELKLDSIPEKTENYIYGKSQGNPLFIEQISLYLFEQDFLDKKGVLKKDVDIVTAFGISDIIGARIDNLTEKIRQLIYYASVLGIEFDIQILSKMLMEDLDHEVEEVVDNCIWDKLKELHYIFSQILFRDTAYSRLLEEKRKKLNVLAAESYEVIYPKEQLNYYFEIIGLHYLRGGDLAKAYKYYGSAFFVAYKDTKLNKAEELALKTYEIVEKLPYSKGRSASSNYCLGLAYHALGNYKEALKYNLEALTLFEEINGKSSVIIAILNNIGNEYSLLNQFEKALDYHGKSLLLRMRELGDQHPEYAVSIMHLGNIFMQTNRNKEAKEHYEQALEILLKSADKAPSRLILCYYNIGAFYIAINENETAIGYLEKAIPILEKSEGLEQPQAASIYRLLGNAYSNIAEFDIGIDYLYKAIKIDERYFGSHHPSSANNYHYLGRSLIFNKKYDKAKEILEKAQNVYIEFYGKNHSASADVVFLIGQYHEGLCEYEKAMQFYIEYKEFLDNNNTNKDKLSELILRMEHINSLL